MAVDYVNSGLYTSLPSLPLTSQQLEHSAARDRIAVKNKLRQTTKQKVNSNLLRYVLIIVGFLFKTVGHGQGD